MFVCCASELRVMHGRFPRYETAFHIRRAYGLRACWLDVFRSRTLDGALTFQEKRTAVQEF